MKGWKAAITTKLGKYSGHAIHEIELFHLEGFKRSFFEVFG
jgi:hypothetical protein